MTLLAGAIAAHAQMTVGDNVNMSLNGYVGLGYSGDFGDTGNSGHGLFGSGTADLSGSYYNPNFLSFHVRPIYNRNQDNSSYASVLSETGVDAAVSLFSGSHFPGSISYSRMFSAGSQYGLPGTNGLNSDSATRNFSVTWSEFLPNVPSLTATFADNATSSTIQGEGGTTDTSSRVLSLMSNYRVDGWGFLGVLNHQNNHVVLPAFLSPTSSESDSSGTSYSVSANHPLPFSGSFVASYNRSDYNSEAAAYRNHGTTDSADATVAFSPTQRFSINGQFRYTGNLIGALQLQLQPGAPPLPTNEESSHGISLNSYGTFNIGHGFQLIGYVNRQMQTFAGVDYRTTRAGGTVTYRYSRPLLGMFYFSFGMVNNAANSGGGNLGFLGSVSFRRQLGAWQVDSDLSYAQNVQTIVAYYTSSNYTYGAQLRRRFGANSYWTGTYRGVQTGLTQLPGYGNRSDTFLTTLTRGRYGISGSYSKSHGTALLSSTGTLNPTVMAAAIAPDQALYDGKVYGVGFNVAPMRKMVINVNWNKMYSDTQTAALFSRNNSERYYGQMQYNLRKLTFRAGYWRVYQGISASGHPPTTDNTYYFNISRWFNLF